MCAAKKVLFPNLVPQVLIISYADSVFFNMSLDEEVRIAWTYTHTHIQPVPVPPGSHQNQPPLTPCVVCA